MAVARLPPDRLNSEKTPWKILGCQDPFERSSRVFPVFLNRADDGGPKVGPIEECLIPPNSPFYPVCLPVLLETSPHFADQAGNLMSPPLSYVARFTLSGGARAAFERFPCFLTRFRSSLRHA